MKLTRKSKARLMGRELSPQGSEAEKHSPNDVNLFTGAGVRLRIVHWDQLPHLQYKMGDRECWTRLSWEEFRRLALGKFVRDVLPWFDDEYAANFREERP